MGFKIGIIGGTGLETSLTELLQDSREINENTPFGMPSDALIEGQINGVQCVLLSRHGREHSVSPSNINYRANIWALKEAGVGVIIACTATGSLREEAKPGDFVIIDSFIDRTTKREQSFYDDQAGHPEGICHIPMRPVFSEKLREILIMAARTLKLPLHTKGTLVCIEGPAFSTLAESNLYRQWTGTTLVGMTLCPEAVLAKELGIPYASVGLVTDYDCWKDNAETVNVNLVAETMHENATSVLKLFIESIRLIQADNESIDGEITKAKEVAKSAVM